MVKLCKTTISVPDPAATFAFAGTSVAAWFDPLLGAPSLCLYGTPGGERALIEELV